MSKAIIKPPINERFLTIAISWNGTKWKIIVVGTKKISKREQANLAFFVNINKNVPEISKIIAAKSMIAAIGSGIPLLTINCVCKLKFVILPGMALTKIALRKSLPKKFRE